MRIERPDPILFGGYAVTPSSLQRIPLGLGSVGYIGLKTKDLTPMKPDPDETPDREMRIERPDPIPLDPIPLTPPT